MLEQPRWKDGEAPQGLLNIAVEDIPLDVSEDAKLNILKACNECSLLGYTTDKEHAFLLDAKTGSVKLIGGERALVGTKSNVDVERWADVLEKAEPLSLMALHNHPNGTTFSVKDVEWFMGSSAVETLIVISETRGYSITKTIPTTNRFEDFRKTAKKIANEKELMRIADRKRRVIEIYKRAFEGFGITIKEW